MAHSPGAGMNKGLPTFRAGGSTARNDLGTRRVDDGINHKSALKTSFFSHDHFSSSLAKSEGMRSGQFAGARSNRTCIVEVIYPYTSISIEPRYGLVKNMDSSFTICMSSPAQPISSAHQLMFSEHMCSPSCASIVHIHNRAYLSCV